MKRYLLFSREYEEEFYGEIKRLKGAGKHGNLIRVVEDSKPIYELDLKEVSRTPIEGQGEHVAWAWVNRKGETVKIDHEEDVYEYGEPVPDGFVKRWDGFQTRIMPLAEAIEIQNAIQRAADSAEQIIYYPNGATGKFMRATGMWSP